MKRLVKLCLMLSLALATLPAMAQVSDEDVDRAREEVNRILEDSAELGEQVQLAWARQAGLEHEIDGLTASIELAEVRLADAWRHLEEVAVELYMGTTGGTSLSLIFHATGDEYEAGLEYLRQVSGVDDSVIDQLRILTGELGRQRERLEEASAEHEILTAELEVMAAALQDDLIVAQAAYDEVVTEQTRQAELARAEAERQAREAAARAATTTSVTVPAASPTTSTSTTSTSTTTTTTIPTTTSTTTTTTVPVAPPPALGGGTCPVAGAVSFTDTWGHPRSGGRTHQGVDMIAARGTPIVAIYGGTIKRISESALGGKQVWLRGGNGDEFFYAHLDDYGAIATGQQVSQGHVIGYNGSSGNAPSWLPHLHFEYHPGGGSAVNPYPLVKSLCG